MPGVATDPVMSRARIPDTVLPMAGLRSTRLGFGGSRLHYLATEGERQALLSAVMDLGCLHIDVAPLYGHGLAERSVGRFLKESPSRRERLVLATKWGIPGTGWMDVLPQGMLRAGVVVETMRRRLLGAPTRPALDRTTLLASVDGSLRRLGVDRIDILWMHEPEAGLITDPADLLDALEDLRAEGKIAAWGVAGYAGHLRSTLALLAEADAAAAALVPRQCDEAEWNGDDVPDVTFGALSQGPQSRAALSIASDTASKRLRAALDRRPEGTVLVSTTRAENMRLLATGLGWA